MWTCAMVRTARAMYPGDQGFPWWKPWRRSSSQGIMLFERLGALPSFCLILPCESCKHQTDHRDVDHRRATARLTLSSLLVCTPAAGMNRCLTLSLRIQWGDLFIRKLLL